MSGQSLETRAVLFYAIYLGSTYSLHFFLEIYMHSNLLLEIF